MIFKYITLFCLLTVTLASPAPEPEPLPLPVPVPEPQPVLSTFISSSTSIVHSVCSIFYLNISLGIGQLCGFTDIITLFAAQSFSGFSGLRQLIEIDIIIGYLESLRVISSGSILIFDLELSIIRLVTVDIIITAVRSRNAFLSGIIILSSGFNFGTVLDLNSFIGVSHCSSVSTSISIGSLFEYGLSTLRRHPCGSCGTLICLPRIIIIETLVCKYRYPIDWFYGVGSFHRRGICPVCI